MARVEVIDVRTTTREEVIDVTALVRAAVKKTAVTDGVAWVSVPHTTAALTLQENTDRTVKSDTLGLLAQLIPRDAGFAHDEGNADAYIKATVIGATQTMFVEDGELMLGRWQSIWFCEFDGPRARQMLVKVVEG
jgi:secondary thiamine-phosphate synthase enzyme